MPANLLMCWMIRIKLSSSRVGQFKLRERWMHKRTPFTFPPSHRDPSARVPWRGTKEASRHALDLPANSSGHPRPTKFVGRHCGTEEGCVFMIHTYSTI